jgi:hypothetical protein
MLVPVILDTASSTYACWCDLVFTLQCYNLDDHVLTETAPSVSFHGLSVVWSSRGSSEQSLLSARMFPFVAALHVGAWVAIEEQFLGNREAHALPRCCLSDFRLGAALCRDEFRGVYRG